MHWHKQNNICHQSTSIAITTEGVVVAVDLCVCNSVVEKYQADECCPSFLWQNSRYSLPRATQYCTLYSVLLTTLRHHISPTHICLGRDTPLLQRQCQQSEQPDWQRIRWRVDLCCIHESYLWGLFCIYSSMCFSLPKFRFFHFCANVSVCHGLWNTSWVLRSIHSPLPQSQSSRISSRSSSLCKIDATKHGYRVVLASLILVVWRWSRYVRLDYRW